MYLSQMMTSSRSHVAALTIKKSFRVLSRTGVIASVALVLSALSGTASAACQYVVSNQWNTGFTGAIRISNSGTSAINSWNVSWQYAGGDRITSSWNATVTGSNPYSASNLNWNGSIQPGQTVEFGIQGNKGGATAEIPVVTGTVCGGVTTSSSVLSSSVPSSSTPSSSVPSSSRSSSKTSSSVSSVPVSTSSSSSISSSISSSSTNSSSKSSVATSSSSVVASSVSSCYAAPAGSVEGNQCNWYGTRYPLCVNTSSGWGYENGVSCISRTTCVTQPQPYGVVICPVSSSSVSTSKSSSSSVKTSSSVTTSASSAPSSIASSTGSSVNSSSSVASSVSSEFTGMSTHFDGLGVPYGGCGIPQTKLETQSFVALNVFNSPGIYTFWTRPITGDNVKYIGEFNNGKNCGRWVRVTIQEFCKGTNDGAQNQAFCRGGTGWVKDGLEGATQDMLVADSCGDDNAWCRDSRYHLDFSLSSMNLFALNGATVNLLPNNDNNRKISWHYIEAPNYTGDINIYFMAGAELWWPAISINHLKNGIHGVEQLVNGVWTAMPMNTDMGQAYILQGGTTHFQIRVRDVNDELINAGRVYTFDLPAACNGKCSDPATPTTYTIQ